MNVTAFNFGFYHYNLTGQLEDVRSMEFSEDEDSSSTISEVSHQFTSTPKWNLRYQSNPTQTDSTSENEKYYGKPTLPETDSDFQRTIFNQVEIETRTCTKTPQETNLSCTKSQGQFSRLFCATQKRWSHELREKALKMAKLNSACNEGSSMASRTQMECKFLQKLESIVSANAMHSKKGNNDVDFACQTISNASSDIRDRISFFNEITSKNQNEKQENRKAGQFLKMLKSTRNAAEATIKAGIIARLPHASTKPMATFENDSSGILQQFSTAAPEISSAKPLESWRESNFMPPNPHTTAGTDEFTTRKAATRSKLTLEKTRCTILKQNVNTISGTRPQMHSMMDDLSLVIPVRFRVSEYEQRIKSEQ